MSLIIYNPDAKFSITFVVYLINQLNLITMKKAIKSLIVCLSNLLYIQSAIFNNLEFAEG